MPKLPYYVVAKREVANCQPGDIVKVIDHEVFEGEIVSVTIDRPTAPRMLAANAFEVLTLDACIQMVWDERTRIVELQDRIDNAANALGYGDVG